MNRPVFHVFWTRRCCLLLAFAVVCLLQAAPVLAQGDVATIQFKSLAYKTNENASRATITVERLGATNSEVRVDFLTENELATAGEDYVATNGTLVFPPGVRQKIFTVMILPDLTVEGNETVILRLVEPLTATVGSAVLSRDNATLTIEDNDRCGFVISPASRTHGSDAVASSFVVYATNGCRWTATESVEWIGLGGGLTGTSNGVVEYSLSPNPTSAPRTGKIFVEGKAFTITQLGAPPQDFTAPMVTFSAPAANARLTNTTEVIVSGKASDKGTGMVAIVEFRLENAAGTNDYQFAGGTTNWSTNVTGLILGTNVVRVRAKDYAENFSPEVTRRFVMVSASPLTVQTNGAGKVSPVLNGKMLEVGRTYTLAATPATRNFFTGWSGGIATNVAKLVFQMQTNLMLQANFVTNPFVATKGDYNGLFFNEDAIQHDTSGFFTASIMESGAFSARATLGGKSVSFSGKLGLDGEFTKTFTRPNTNSLTLHLSLDIAGGSAQLTGSLGDGNFLSDIIADRAKTRGATNFNGSYTLVIPGTNHPASGPGGDSTGTMTVKAGSLSFVGSLADGTPIAQKIPLSQDGSWPFFQSLYSKGGTMLGWIGFTNRMEDDAQDDLHGDLSWIKPVSTKTRFYTNGFAYRITATGSRYQSSASPMLSFTNATMGFAGGNLIESFTNVVVLTNATKLLNLSSNKLTFTLTNKNGAFSGKVTDPNGGKIFSYNGVVHQKGRYGAGFLSGTNETGPVRLEGAP